MKDFVKKIEELADFHEDKKEERVGHNNKRDERIQHTSIGFCFNATKIG